MAFWWVHALLRPRSFWDGSHLLISRSAFVASVPEHARRRSVSASLAIWLLGLLYSRWRFAVAGTRPRFVTSINKRCLVKRKISCLRSLTVLTDFLLLALSFWMSIDNRQFGGLIQRRLRWTSELSTELLGSRLSWGLSFNYLPTFLHRALAKSWGVTSFLVHRFPILGLLVSQFLNLLPQFFDLFP